MTSSHSPDPDHRTRNGLTRRHLLQLGGAGLGAAAVPWTLSAGASAATDPYAALRSAWAAYLSGGAIDPSNPVYAPAISGLDNLAGAWLGSIQTGSGRTALWPDLPLGSVSANITGSLSRLRILALAYVTPGTKYTGSASLVSVIASGLDFLTSGAYAPTAAPYNNWWDWQIGSAQALQDTAVLISDQLTSAQIANCCASIDAFVPDPTKQMVISSSGTTSTTTSTGANRLDMCRVTIVRGALGGSPTPISAGVSALSPVLPLVMTGDGLYADGSYQQHSGMAYTGTYGKIFFNDIAALVLLLQGSSWAITDPNLSVIYAGVSNGLIPVVYNGLMIDAVRGRAVSRYLETDAYDGFGAALTVLLYAQARSSTDPATAAVWRSTAKGWLTRNAVTTVASTVSRVVDGTTGASVTDAASGPGCAAIALAETVLADSSITAGTEPIVHTQFPDMDRVIHRRPGWAYAIAMSSARIKRYESINGENLHGWYTGDGMGYLNLDHGVSQFNDAYWDTVDPHRLPGTTADQGSVANAVGEATKPSTRWVGGVTLAGTYGAVGMQLQAYSTDLTAAKSWFCLDDKIVALGAGITSTSGNDVVTTVENRNLHAVGKNSLAINGTQQAISAGWSSTRNGVTSACISLIAGYCFLDSGGANNVQFALTNRTGNWYDVNTLSPGTATSLPDDTRPYLSIVLDHGANPSGASYAYAILPGASASQTAAYASSQTAKVLSNTPSAQAITDSGLGVTMANFFAAGTAGPITVDAPASVATQVSGTELTIAVSDPTRAASTIHVTVEAGGFTSVVSADPSVTVLSTSGGTIKLLVETGGSHGAGHSVTVTAGGTLTPASAQLLTATENTYVRDGSYAGTNYGGQSTMVVKKASTGYARISLLKFDASQVTGTVARAILWVQGYVSDSGGTQTDLTAYGLSDTSWSQNTVTWTTAPSLTTAYGTGQISTATDWIGLDVTGLVRSAAGGTAGIGLYQQSPGLAVILDTFQQGSGKAPVLEVVTH